jgi:site-specific DNA-cytosine methylase
MRESGQGYWMQDEIASLRAEERIDQACPAMLSSRRPWHVRRLTPRECERLQGFPDDYTAIPWRGKEAPDGPRYKALGNSMAVPVMRWIGKRIQQVEKILDER